MKASRPNRKSKIQDWSFGAYLRFVAGRHLDFGLSASLGQCRQYLLGFGHCKNVGYLPVFIGYLNPLVI